MQAQFEFPSTPDEPVLMTTPAAVARVYRRRLVILGCSATKVATQEWVTANELYNGPLWQTLRSADPDRSIAAHAFLSAHHGFGEANFRALNNYNLRMTPERAAEMIAGGLVTRWPRPPSRKKPDSYGIHAACEINAMVGYGGAPFDDLALVGGDLYIQVMRAFVALFQASGYVAFDARVTVINAPIGYMRQQLREWLLPSEQMLRNFELHHS